MTPPRPTRDAAIALARKEFVHGRRVEVGRLADRLHVDRTTLYRWVGDRDQLLSIVLADLAEDTAVQVSAGVPGRGLGPAMDVLRRFITATSSFPPAVEFAQREPGPALRIMLAQEGIVMDRVRRIIRDLLDPRLPEEMVPIPDHLVEVIAQLASALQWALISIGEAPPIERVLGVVESMLRDAYEAAENNGSMPVTDR